MTTPPLRNASPAPFPATPAGIDRSGEERSIDGLLDTLRADPTSRVLVMHGDAVPLAGPGALHYVAPDAVSGGAQWAFLGRDAGGAAVLLAVLDAGPGQHDGGDGDPPLAAPGGWGMLRVIGGDLSPEDAGTLVEAMSLGRWLRDAPFCPACGARTETRTAGWARHCPSCGREHFPRTDPAVIVAVTSAGDPKRLLLGSNVLWGGRRYSCFAGFVEAGESLEATVVREVREEAGVELAEIRYRGSQGWPYPRSLMVGFAAIATDDEAARPDGEEIVAVRWFDRQEIAAALAGEGDVVLPGTASIARRLIEDWHAASA